MLLTLFIVWRRPESFLCEVDEETDQETVEVSQKRDFSSCSITKRGDRLLRVYFKTPTDTNISEKVWLSILRSILEMWIFKFFRLDNVIKDLCHKDLNHLIRSSWIFIVFGVIPGGYFMYVGRGGGRANLP